MIAKYTVEKLDHLVGNTPFGLTHGVYCVTPIGPVAVALCFTEDDAQRVRDALESLEDGHHAKCCPRDNI